MIVAAVSSKVSKKPNQPTHVLVDKNPAFRCPSIVLLEQISTIDKKRICNFMGMTTDQEMQQIENALKCSLALDRCQKKLCIRVMPTVSCFGITRMS